MLPNTKLHRAKRAVLDVWHIEFLFLNNDMRYHKRHL
jgi:hypothetical protein